MINELWHVLVRYAVLMVVIVVIVGIGAWSLLLLGFDRYCAWIKND